MWTYAALFCAFLLLCAGVMESFSSLLLRALPINSSLRRSDPIFWAIWPLLELKLGPEFLRELEGDIDGTGLCCDDDC